MAINILNTVFFFAFLLSAAVQYNDPDATAWLAAYLAAAYMCFAQMRQKLWRWLPPILLLGSLLWILITLPKIAGQANWHDIFESVTMKSKAVEEAREIGGLALIAFWSAALFFRSQKTKSGRS